MLNSTHPDDERLSALASRDVDMAADASLSDHLAGCDRCTALVAELTALRSTLADLPDLRPDRPLRLLPPAEETSSAPGAVGWVRRLFAPVMTAGAALALVGAVGTAAPQVTVGIFSNVGSELSGGADAEEFDRAGDGDEPAQALSSSDEGTPGEAAAPTAAGDDMSAMNRDGLPAERSLWPMILFTGVALMIGAALLRWILVPRAG